MDISLEADDYFDLVLYHSDPGGGRVSLGPVARWQTWWRVAARHLARSHPALTMACAQGFVLRSDQLRDLGVTRQQTRTLVASGAWSSPQPGTVAVVDPAADHGLGNDEWSLVRRRHALASAAAALRSPGFVVCGTSAAIMLGLPTMDVLSIPLLSAPPTLHTRRRRVAGLVAAEADDWFGIATTSPARTAVDVARRDRREGLIVLDAVLREGLVDRASLGQAIERAAGWQGVRAARQLVALADGLSESPLESITRLALQDSGFPAPELQVEIAVPGRRAPYRVDLCWPEFRLILECDGRVKYREDQRWREKQREVELRRAGYRVERILWRDVLRDWAATETYLGPLLKASPVPARG